MRYKVKLRLHEDDNGFWGLCHENTVGKFNAFWGADGVFHDVFEHYFEGHHKYFNAKAELTLWGEMAASGHGIAYRNIGIDSFRYRQGFSRRDFTLDTKSVLENAVYEIEQEPDLEPWLEYPITHTLCLVPPQRKAIGGGSYALYHWISEYDYWISETRKHENLAVRKFAKTISKSCMQRCYLWGWKRAMKIIGGDIEHSRKVLDEFLKTWHNITKSEVQSLYILDDYAYPIRNFVFTITTAPKLKIKTEIEDEVGNSYNFNLLNILE